ncbi:heterokaryon incompatibility protein-domain-containing protein [Cercophora newfieldiana]|uniref:Heterokaryon incompatibility protein-domain-containing protein n=1 Tax=Cercophora newfieldiana TaxID=92897 RepID=A0AA39Y1V7_9PEZI|nr:heterokaryon incompatibility protein-domain-containing protein [Cercophora newfieldiana]
MTSPSSEYPYDRRLTEREIRLLSIENAGEDDGGDGPIHCALGYHSLDACIDFRALSYVWGQGSRTSPIIVDGQPCLVTDNLLQALRHIWMRWKRVIIWADAICINQDDTEEKTAQVRMMRDIYSQASQVIIWLGEPGPDHHLGIRLAEQLGNARSYRDDKILLEIDGVAATWIDRLQVDGGAVPDAFFQGSDYSWSALASLYTREWYTRVWVVQELLMAKQAIFLLGVTDISAEVLLYPAYLMKINQRITGHMRQNEREESNPMRMSANVAQLYFTAKGRGSRNFELLTLLDQTRYSAATDPRDRIFALIGMTHNIPQDFISYSLTEKEVITNLQVRALGEGSSLDALARVDISSLHRRTGLPSWVPNWTLPDGPSDRRLMDELVDPVLKMSNWPRNDSGIWGQGESPITINNGLLTASGKSIDRIRSIVPGYLFFISGNPSFLDLFGRFHTWIGHLQHLTSTLETHLTGSTIEDATWRALIGIAAELPDADSEFGAFFSPWKQVCTLVYLYCILQDPDRGKELEPSLSDEEREILARMAVDEEFRLGVPHLYTPAGLQRFVAALQLYGVGRKFCVTEKGYLGWVPDDAKVGDEIVALKGTRLLFVARDEGKRQEGSSTAGLGGEKGKVRLLVGAAWFYGLMRGEPGEMDEIPVEHVIFG